MVKSFVRAAVVAVALSAAAAIVPAAHAAEYSKAAAKTLQPMMDALKAKRYDEAIAKAREVLAIPEKNAYDTFLAYSALAAAYYEKHNTAEQLKAMQGQIDSGHLGAAEQNKIVAQMVNAAYNAKDYPQAVELGNRAIKNGVATPETYEAISEALAQQGKTAEAAKFLGDFVTEQEKHGQMPRERTLTNLRALQDKAGNKAGAADTLEKLVVHYPKPEYWDLITYTLTRSPMTDRQKLQVYRLKMATGTLKRCGDFDDMADRASAAGMTGEAQKALDQAMGSRTCSDKAEADRVHRHLDAAVKLVAEDKAKFSKLEADAKVAKTGEADVLIGAQLFGNEEYAKAAEALSRGIAKGGLKYAADAQMTLATAQYRANNKAEALKTLRSIKTEDPVMQRIIRLWTLRLNSEGGAGGHK